MGLRGSLEVNTPISPKLLPKMSERFRRILNFETLYAFSKKIYRLKTESRCKPGSVEKHHSSRSLVTQGLERPTRLLGVAPLKRRPIWTCTT
jgi:hypothetical protein